MTALDQASPRPALAPLVPMLVKQTWYGLLGLWRIPAFTISGLVLPVMFFAFFGLPNVGRTLQGINAGAYMLASFGAYAVGSMMVFNFGIGVSGDRAAKLDLLYRATPLPPLLYMVSKLLVAALFALLSLLLLFGFGAVVGGIHMPAGQWVQIIARLILGSVTFAALGFAIGYSVSSHAAPGVANLIYLPLSFASGLFVPLQSMPQFIQQVAPYLPTYHYGQLAWGAAGAPAESLPASLVWLAAYTVVFLALAARGYYAEEQRKFG
jgi:ABC-2 type transport system permease protein